MLNAMGNAIEYIPRGKSLREENRFKWVLAALLVVIIILLILIGVLSVYVNLSGESLCTTKECLQSAAAIISSMDKKCDPCEDFYKFACNKFEELNLGHAHPMNEYTHIHRITNRLNHVIQNFLEKPLKKEDRAPIRMVKTFYNACKDKAKRSELGYSVMDKYLLQAGLPKMPNVFTLPMEGWNNYTFSWVKTAVALKKIFAIDLFVNVEYEEGKLRIVADFEPPKIPQLFTHEEFALYSKVIKDEFKLAVVHVISEILALEPKIKNYRKILDVVSDTIWNMTRDEYQAKKLVGGGKNYEIRNDELKNISLADLQNITDTMLKENGFPPVVAGEDWRSYVTLLFTEITQQSVNFTETDVLYYFEKELPYIISVPLLVAKTPNIMLEMFAWWKAIFLMIANTTQEIAQTLNELLYSFSKSALENCVDLASENFNSAMQFGIITETFLKETKPSVEEFVESLRDSFLERLQTIDWLDDVTREIAIKKLRAIKVFVGAPNWIVNETRVMNEFSILNISDSHLDNLMQIVQSSVVADFQKYFQNDTEKQITSADYGNINEVNAYYYPLISSIAIPWAILNHPVYHLGLPSLDYGALGGVIGHEIIHAFDGTGRLYDEESNFKMWFTQKSLTNFEQKSKCFVEQYENFTIRIGKKYFKVNGTNTLNENMADNGGMRMAYHAFKKYSEKNGPEHHLPGLSEFTSEQLFFLSNAHLWCFSEGSDWEQLVIQLDEHAPKNVQVNAMAQNIPEFSEAFNCPLGSKMNPKRNRCDMY